MSQVSLSRAAPGHLVLTVDGANHSIRFPDTGNLESIVLKVLSGAEYPTLRAPGFAPATILDIGANVGATAVFFGLAYPKADIVCFEPSPSTAGLLRNNVGWMPQVEVHELGLLDTDTTLRLYQGTVQCAQASVSLSVETRSDTYEDIKLVRARPALEHYLSRGPVLLKMDTEGCEVPVLRDLGDLIDRVDVMYIEYHSERDRRAIDALLGSRFQLWKSDAHHIHRGTVAYVHERVVARWPELGALEIPALDPAAA